MDILKDPHDFLRDIYPPLKGMVDQLDTEPRIPAIPNPTPPPQYNNPCPYWHAYAPAPAPKEKRDWGTTICCGYTILVAGVLLIKLFFDSVLK